MKWKVLKHKRNNNKRYVLTGKRCPSHLKNKNVNKKRKVAKAQRIANRKFKNKMAKVAKKQARGGRKSPAYRQPQVQKQNGKSGQETSSSGRTFEKCVHDLLKVSGKKTLNEICAKLCKQPGMKCNKFVLRHVMERLRAKKVVKIYQFRYSVTG